MRSSRLWFAQLAGLAHALPQLAAGRRFRTPDQPLRVHFVYEQLGAPMRYRVLHQMEQARLGGLLVQGSSVDAVVNGYGIADCDLLYLHRIALNSRTWPLIVFARLLGIPIIFDSDDLVWDEKERSYNYLDIHYPPEIVRNILRTTRRINALMHRVDAFVFATPFLAQLAQATFPQRVFVNPNALAREQITLAERSFRFHQRRLDSVVIGYFSGTPNVHDEDFASIAPALVEVLARYTTVRLRIYGNVTLPNQLADRFADRIERRQVVAWNLLPDHIVDVDINIAPLVDNPQRRAKSAVKYYEAALLRVPTVASHLEPYADVVIDGITGLLATTVAEWTESLLKLACSPELRQTIGQAAYTRVLAEHTTDVRAPHFVSILHTLANKKAFVGRYSREEL